MSLPEQLLLSLSDSRQNPHNPLFILKSYSTSEVSYPRFVYRSEGGDQLD